MFQTRFHGKSFVYCLVPCPAFKRFDLFSFDVFLFLFILPGTNSRSPSSALLPTFLGVFGPTKIDETEKPEPVPTYNLSNLEDLVMVAIFFPPVVFMV